MVTGPGLHIDDPSDPSLDLTMSDGARPLYDQVRSFIADEVEPDWAKTWFAPVCNLDLGSS